MLLVVDFRVRRVTLRAVELGLFHCRPHPASSRSLRIRGSTIVVDALSFRKEPCCLGYNRQGGWSVGPSTSAGSRYFALSEPSEPLP
jgi:hypothetical protein